jgi:predicted acyl esterase
MSKYLKNPKKEVSTLERTINVDGQQSDLVVKMDFNTAKGTFNLTTKLTTVQFDGTNEAVNDGTLNTLKDMLKEAAAEMMAKRREFLAGQDGDPDQMPIGFNTGEPAPE